MSKFAYAVSQRPAFHQCQRLQMDSLLTKYRKRFNGGKGR